jgi:hypothetical protein
LCGGRLTHQQIQETESQILSAVQWRVNPPTAIAFVRGLLELSLPESHKLPDNRTTLNGDLVTCMGGTFVFCNTG